MQQKLDDHYLKQFLNQKKLAVLSTVGTDGKPYAAPIYFVMNDDFTFLFITPEGTQKFKNIEHNPNVVLTVTDESTWETVRIAGSARFDASLVSEVVNKLAEKLDDGQTVAKKLPVLQHGHSNKVAVVISPSTVGMRRYSSEVLEEHNIDFN